MVKGLSIFRKYFENYTENFVVIGGTACFLSMENAGVPFRVTKDIDIVLLIEAIDTPFVETIWKFIKEGGYQVREKESGKKQLYRFLKPENTDYPFMIEFFSRKPDMLQISGSSTVTPVPTDEAVSSLSAILLDDDYYQFIRSGKIILEGIPSVRPEHLIPLKAKAFLDLSERREKGESIDSRDISKHRNDIFRLTMIADPEFKADIPEKISDDMNIFIEKMNLETVDLKTLGIKGISKELLLKQLKMMYL
ncbi:MAG TPA: hypothetical protein PLD55_06045 [bacterium]|jgi:hypothetical protein|nr:hypothetical protein [bacterium]HNZ53542.1 hypothetical protein [bacterium]HOB72729.1 hypothetical protein [bacterium]HOG44223.1 hypothetical protein [bacterium]HPV20514.1 hypothetical protein [bacterium]